MSGKIYNVLVLCTGNSARSILAEAIFNREGRGRVRAYSAGSHPKGVPNPFALELLASLGHDIADLRSKSWSEFSGPGAPELDLVVTVCDAAAGEACPYWPGTPMRAHWGIPDPADVQGTDDHKRAAFRLAHDRLHARIAALMQLPFETLAAAELKIQLATIGRMEGATGPAAAGGKG